MKPNLGAKERLIHDQAAIMIRVIRDKAIEGIMMRVIDYQQRKESKHLEKLRDNAAKSGCKCSQIWVQKRD